MARGYRKDGSKLGFKPGQMTGAKHPRWQGGRDGQTYKEKQKEYLRRVRLAALEILGGKCVVCGFSDGRALQIDHINGNGSTERKKRAFRGNFHNHVIQSYLAGDGKYQLLCANCNWIKRVENNEMVRSG